MFPLTVWRVVVVKKAHTHSLSTVECVASVVQSALLLTLFVRSCVSVPDQMDPREWSIERGREGETAVIGDR